MEEYKIKTNEDNLFDYLMNLEDSEDFNPKPSKKDSEYFGISEESMKVIDGFNGEGFSKHAFIDKFLEAVKQLEESSDKESVSTENGDRKSDTLENTENSSGEEISTIEESPTYIKDRNEAIDFFIRYVLDLNHDEAFKGNSFMSPELMDKLIHSYLIYDIEKRFERYDKTHKKWERRKSEASKEEQVRRNQEEQRKLQNKLKEQKREEEHRAVREKALKEEKDKKKMILGFGIAGILLGIFSLTSDHTIIGTLLIVYGVLAFGVYLF